MEVMCQRQREELNRYKAHVGDLSSQLWNVGEKLLIEQQQKQDTLQRLKDLETKVKEFQVDQPMATISRKTCRYVQLCILSLNEINIIKKIYCQFNNQLINPLQNGKARNVT